MFTNGKDSMQSAIFRLKKIGPIKEAEMELGDLTIIAGRNNTGKTYLAYALYGFLKIWRELATSIPPNVDHFVKTLMATGKAKQPVDRNGLKQARQAMLQRVTKIFSKQILPDVFSASQAAFEGASLEMVLNDAFPADVQSRKQGHFSIAYDGSDIVIERDPLPRYDVSVDKPPSQYLINYGKIQSIVYRLYASLLSPDFPHPLVLSAERFGISLFYKELDFTKNQLVNLLQKMGDDKDRDRFSPFRLIDETTSRYALPVKDNIDYTRNISDFLRRKSEIYEDKLFNDIKNMMDGYYRRSGDDTEFISKARGKRRFHIPLHTASSSVRGLSDLYFFLRHVAQKNHLLIIDDPESQLDTTNQIQLARLLARLVRAGLKILITTHSDYLIKEINNLVMLSRSFDNKTKVVEKLGYKADDFLNPDSIRAYVAEGNGLSRCAVDGFGIDMPVFDETIDKINRVSNELAARLAAEDGHVFE